MKFFSYLIICIISILFLTTSCVSRKEFVYLNTIDSGETLSGNSNYEPILKPDDLLSIIVSSEQPELSIPFNLPQIQGNYELNQGQTNMKSYLVDIEGNIDFPVIGKMKMAGLTRTKAKEILETAIKEHILNPSVNLRILNYKISVLGEVKNSGTYPISSERITVLEAISMAGDMTIYGKRDNVLIIREIDGRKSFNRIDLTKTDFVNSPYYYLNQNDVVVVEPNKTRINSSAVGPNVTATISVLSLMATIIILILR